MFRNLFHHLKFLFPYLRLTVCVCGAWRWGGRGQGLGAGKTRSQKNAAADWASERQANIAQPKRMSAGQSHTSTAPPENEDHPLSGKKPGRNGSILRMADIQAVQSSGDALLS
jgi:hypothetical protein